MQKIDLVLLLLIVVIAIQLYCLFTQKSNEEDYTADGSPCKKGSDCSSKNCVGGVCARIQGSNKQNRQNRQNSQTI